MSRPNLGKTASSRPTLKKAVAASTDPRYAEPLANPAVSGKKVKRQPHDPRSAMAEAQAARSRIEDGRKTRAGGRFTRAPGETRAARYISSIRLDIVSAEILKIHAFQRRVHIATLLSDVVNVWLERATDYSQSLIKECLPPGVRHAAVPERYAGYLASLGYVPSLTGEAMSPQEEVAQIVQPPVTHPWKGPDAIAPLDPPVVPPPPPMEAVTLAQVAPHEREIGDGERAVVPEAAPSVADAPIQRVVAGWGSAAQRYGMGMNPGEKGLDQEMADERDAIVAEMRKRAAAARREHMIPEERFGVKPD